MTLPEGVTINPSVGAGPRRLHAEPSTKGETPSSPFGAGCPSESKIGDFSVNSPIVSGPIDGAHLSRRAPRQPLRQPARRLPGRQVDPAGHPGQGRRRAEARPGHAAASPRSSTSCRSCPTRTSTSTSAKASAARWRRRRPAARSRPRPTSRRGATPTWSGTNRCPPTIAAGVGGGPCPSGLAPFAPQAKGGMLNSRAGAYTPFYLHLTRKVDRTGDRLLLGPVPAGPAGQDRRHPLLPGGRDRSGAAQLGGGGARPPLLPGGEPDRPHLLRLRRRLGARLRARQPLPRRSLPRLRLLGGGDRLGPGRALRPRRGDRALGGPHRPGRPRRPRSTPPAPTRSPTSSTASRSTCATSAPTSTAPTSPLNPTSCEPFTRRLGAERRRPALRRSRRRHAGDGHRALPGLRLRLARLQAADRRCGCKGGTKRGDYPSLRVVVRPRPGDANIASAAGDAAALDLPRPGQHQDDLHQRRSSPPTACPPGSVYGHVRAFTPLLEAPMEGPAYLRSSSHTLPDLVFALRGHGIEVDVAGRIDSFKGGIRGTFPTIPDAPVTKFVLKLNGGKRGVLVNAENLCARQAAGRRQVHRARQPRLALAPGGEGRVQEEEEERAGQVRIRDARWQSSPALLLAGLSAGRRRGRGLPAALASPGRRAGRVARTSPLAFAEGQIEGACGLAISPARQPLRLRLLPPRHSHLHPRGPLQRHASSWPAAIRTRARTDQRTQRGLRPGRRCRPATATPTNSSQGVMRLPGEEVDRPRHIDRGRRRRRGQPLRRRPHLRRGLRRAGRTGRGAGRENRPRQLRRCLRRRGRLRKPAGSTSPMRRARRSRSSTRRSNLGDPGRRRSTARPGRQLQLAGRRGACRRRQRRRRQRPPARRRQPQTAAPRSRKPRSTSSTPPATTWTGCRSGHGGPSAKSGKKDRSSANRPESPSIPEQAISTSRPATARIRTWSSTGRSNRLPRRRWRLGIGRRLRRRGRRARESGGGAAARATSQRRLGLGGRTASRRAGQLRRQAHPARPSPPRHGPGRDRRRREDQRHRRQGSAAAAADHDRDQSQRSLHLQGPADLPRRRDPALDHRRRPRGLSPRAGRRRPLLRQRQAARAVAVPLRRQGPRLQRQGRRQAGDPRPHLRHPAGADLDRAALL